jgi:biotin carboxyl carrier protein
MYFLVFSMNKIKINDRTELDVSVQDATASVNEKLLSWDMQELPNGTFSILANGRNFNAVVENIDRAAKVLKMKINGNSYDLAIKEPIDQMLQKMGLNISTVKKVDAIKAPMPGLVLKVLVEEGQAIKKGDPVLILEAMKMENVFKAPADAIVKSIKVEERKAVEKGEVLIELA